MFNNKENIRIINFDSIILLLIIFFGLLIHNGKVSSSVAQNRNPVLTYESTGDKYAVFNPGIQVQILQKIWLLNRDNFQFQVFTGNLLSDDRKTGIIISNLEKPDQNTLRFSSFIFRYCLFPAEKDEFPLLS